MGIGNIANTGMRAAMTDMEVISSNISNANTVGYKASYATFGDVYPSSSAGANLQSGLGVKLTGIHQDFKRGGFELSGSQMDLMITGSGFFVLRDSTSGVKSYTRNGHFQPDKDGYITNGNLRLQGFPAVNGEIFAGGSLTDLQISKQPRNATATSKITEDLNLKSTEAVKTDPFDVNNPNSYNYSTSKTIYDSLGNTHALSMYYIKTADNNWSAQTLIDGANVGTGTIVFGTDGKLSSVSGLSALSFTPGGGAASPQALSIDLSTSTQYASDNQTRKLTQNGYPVGIVNGTEIDKDGNVIATYSNDERVLLGKIALAEFQAPNGLTSIGNMSWLETSDSGSPIINPGNSDKNISSGALELSNVDLTQEMIKLIGAQHSFQANAQVEQTYNEVMQTVIKI
jgi:flagellar hook protein FlgE